MVQKTKARTVTPFKAVVQIVAAVRDEKNEIRNELGIDTPIVLYLPEIDGKLRERIYEIWPAVEQQFEAQQNGTGLDPG